MNHNWNADLLLTQVDTPIRFHLYGCFLDLINISTNDKEVWGSDSDGGYHRLRKTDILLACPVDVQRHIKTDASITNPQLKQRSLFVSERKLESVVKHNIVLFTRGNHVICGELQAFDQYHLFMRVGNKVVLVYRHGLSDFKKEKVPSQTKTNDLRKLEKNEKVQKTTLKKRKFRQGDEHIPSDYTAITAHNEKRLGTDTASRKTQVSMYSDSTHFVYEILQNADDHGATEVCFKLSENEIVIEHNGELFTKENVEAITYFGKSTSRNDLVKTGRFGVGFKSVFAFTATPIIISGDEHFQIYGLYRIREYPYPDGFSRSRTRIVLSFNHESEQPDFVEKLMRREEAYTQISKCLTTLNMDTLLFTQNIQEIRWEIDNHSAYYQREDEIDNNVRFTTITDGREENKYVVFSKVPKWENQAYKAVEIAFAVDTQDQLSSIDNDSLYVLFRTAERTGLKFILNGPYRTNPARETISETDDFNLHLMKVTCELVKETLPYLRDRNLLTVEFLSVLPNQEDAVLEFYTPLRDIIVDEFRNEKLTPTRREDYEAASRLYQDRSGRGLSSLIQDEDLATLLGKDKAAPLWVANTSQLTQKRDERSGRYVQDTNAQRRNKRIEDFLSMLDILEWKTEDLIRALEPQSNLVMEWLKEKSEIWHQRFYVLLDDFISSIRWNYIEGQQYRTILEKLRIVRCSDGIHRSGRECYFLNDDAEPDVDLFSDALALEEETQLQIQEEDGHEEHFYYVAKGVYSSGQNNDRQKKAREFLETIGVREVDETERIKMILKQRYTPESIKPRETDLERFIKLVEEDPIKAELFKSYPIFQNDRDLDNKNWWASPEKIFLDSPYLETGLTVYYETIGKDSNRRRALSSKYAKSNIDPEKLGKFAATVGAQTQLQPLKQEIPLDHPEWKTNLSQAPGQRQTDTTIDEDYTILEFDVLCNSPSIIKAKLIWRTMCALPERYLKARFRWNQSNELREAHSSLVYDLRKAEWVPQESEDSPTFVHPRDASIERLPTGFPYETGQKWFESVKFGEAAEKQRLEQILKKNEKSNQNQRAQEIGFSSGDEAETMAELAKILRAQGKSPEEMLDEISTEKRRAERLTIELSDAEEKQYEIRARSIRSTRNTIDPHTPLREQYTKFNNMECQMCRQEMPFKKRNSDDDYFEAVEAFGKDYFPKEHEAQHLALCPECAAKYKEYVKKDRAARKVLYNLLKDSDESEVRLELNDLAIRIWFNEKHWHDLKTVLHYYEEVSQSAWADRQDAQPRRDAAPPGGRHKDDSLDFTGIWSKREKPRMMTFTNGEEVAFINKVPTNARAAVESEMVKLGYWQDNDSEDLTVLPSTSINFEKIGHALEIELDDID